MVLDTIGIVVFLALIGFGIKSYRSTKKKNKTKMSFKEAMDLASLPVVTFYRGNNKYNFLLDTGSDNSVINKSVFDTLKNTTIVAKSTTVGMTGEEVACEIAQIDFYYREDRFVSEFSVHDMEQAFSFLKRETGVQIHGILGSRFFEEYKYVLDFKDLIAYRR